MGGISEGPIRVQAGDGQKGLVIEHFLEMGREPLTVDGVAVDAGADLVPDTAGPHMLKCFPDHFPGGVRAGFFPVSDKE